MLMYRGLRGSRLHGFATPESDWDYIEIWDRITPWDNPPWGQTIDSSVEPATDTLRAGLSEFMRWADSGSPVALEAIFSPDWAVEYDMLRAWRYAFRPNLDAARAVYSRTTRKFSYSGTPKQQRHAARLQYDLDALLTQGYFDPSGYARSLS